MDAELRRGDKRSTVYRQGMVDILALKLNGTPLPSPYRAGSVEFDAWIAGIDRGHHLLRTIQETK